MSGYIDDGTREFVQTKGGSTLKILGSDNNLSIMGGGDIEEGTTPAHIIRNEQTGALDRYDADNGRIFFINRVLQDPTHSVKNILSLHEEYSSFYNLLIGNDAVFKYFDKDKEISSIFSLNKTSESSGLGEIVSSFNNFRYTVFVPTNAAIAEAFRKDKNLHTWEEIADQDDATIKREWAVHLIRFLKYHLMDNSIYVDNKVSTGTYETAARSNSSKFQTLKVSNNGSNLSITDAHGNVAHVNKLAGLYNVQGRDFIVNAEDYRNAEQMISSSFSVIHLIDKALMPE